MSTDNMNVPPSSPFFDGRKAAKVENHAPAGRAVPAASYQSGALSKAPLKSTDHGGHRGHDPRTGNPV